MGADIADDCFSSDRAYSSFDLFTQTSLDQVLVPGFFQQHNPLVRHIVLRRREALKNQGLLERAGVVVYPDPKMGANAYPIFGGLPDAIEDEWIENTEDEWIENTEDEWIENTEDEWIENIEELKAQMDQYIHLRQQARNAFDLRDESSIEPEFNRCERCWRMLSRRDIIAKLSEPW